MDKDDVIDSLAKQTMRYTEHIIQIMKRIRDSNIAAHGQLAYEMFPIHSDNDYEFMRIRLFESFFLFAQTKLVSLTDDEYARMAGDMKLTSAFANVLGADKGALLADIMKPSVQPGLRNSLKVLSDNDLYEGIVNECTENITKALKQHIAQIKKVMKNH